MRSFHARGVASALVLASLATTALAQDAGIPSLLPLPPAQPAYPIYPVSQAAATDVLWANQEESPAPAPVIDNLPGPGGDQHSVISPDYENALYGSEGCDTCDSCGCCPDFYAYGNVLWMTREKRGGFVTSIDSATFTPELFFCDPGYGGLWYGGFEVGGGWCLCGNGCGCCGTTALEVTYWGLFPGNESRVAVGPLDSMIDFSNLDYNGAGLDTIFNGAAAHQLQFQYDIHSVEVQLVGNGACGGPFGCGRLCTCSGSGCGSRFGFGWLAGFRYIDYSENFLFSADFDDTVFDGDATEASYAVDLDNDLVGFQIGSGLNFCLTQRLSTYAIGRMGVYNNHIRQHQSVFGSAGPVVVNNGPNAGLTYDVISQKDELAVVGQLDFGVRWNMSECWSFDLGYRILGLSGVAIAEDNVQQGNLQNLEGIADIQTQGTVLLHGGYAGVTYSW